MAKVIKVFRERQHNYKRYETGDDYPENDEKRVAYLVRQGFLEKVKPKSKKGADKDGSTDA